MTTHTVDERDLTNLVHYWAKNETYKYREPTVKNFLHFYSEYDHKGLYPIIETEIKKVAALPQKF